MSRRLAWRIAASATLLGLCVPAQAQWTGTRMGHTANTGTKDVNAVIALIAQCVTKDRPGLVHEWLNILPGTPEEERYFDGHIEDLERCLQDNRLVVANRELVVRPSHLRGPIAIVAARRLIERSPGSFIPAKDSPPWFEAAYKARPAGSSVNGSMLALQDFGHCVAVNNWAGTRALLLSKPDSRQQRDAVTAITPSLGPCLTNAATVSLTPANLRAALSEPVYHILDSGSAAPAGSERGQ